ITIGIFFASFEGLESIHHGIFSVNFIMSILPGLILIGIGITSRSYPKVASVIMTVLTIALVSFILMKKNASGITAVIVGVPLFTASLGLWRGSKKNSDDQVE
ncbi:MAG: hypothetical protein KKD38_05130, partial [Candidatus Delongbacteria bacterium]|nr:hypothetical protein [Candidatus Delongbacteria bacterium]MCG2759620.1 hypothetical protein [Candidatus Delongbacteria bacterium]